MTRKHFEAIAHTLNANLAPLELVLDMADTLAEYNSLFDRERFVKASTLELSKQHDYYSNTLAKIHGKV